MTETQAKSGNTGTSANPVDEEAAEGRRTSDRPRGRGPGDGPRRRAVPPKFTRAPGMTPPPEQPPATTPSPADKTEAPGAEAPTSAAATPPACRRRHPSAVRRRTQPIGVRPGQAASTGSTGTQPRIAPGMTRPQPDAARPAPLPAARPAARGLPPGVGSASAVGAARVAEAVRAARTLGQLGRRPRPAPGPAEPQADRPVVGDEVLLRGLGGAVHRGRRRHLGALPGAGRDGRVRQRQREPRATWSTPAVAERQRLPDHRQGRDRHARR